MSNNYIKKLVKQKQYVEALYFGALELSKSPNKELHLYLGLACCAVIQPVARVERYMADPEAMKEKVIEPVGLLVGRATHIIYEGFFHLLEATKEGDDVHFDASLEDNIKEIIIDVEDYLHQDFHGCPTKKSYQLKKVGVGALILLKEFVNDKSDMKRYAKRMKEKAMEMIEELKANGGGDADFYALERDKKGYVEVQL